MDANKRVSLAFRDLNEIPANIIAKHSGKALVLDLTHNHFSDLRSLEDFTNIHTLILDNNDLKSHMKFPSLPTLHTLWVNRNRISNLTVFIETLTATFPQLQYLSMMNNPAAPSFFNGGTFNQYIDYRHYVVSQLPKLRILDDKPVTSEERQEAERVYKHIISKGRRSQKDRKSSNKSRHMSKNSQLNNNPVATGDLPSVDDLTKT